MEKLASTLLDLDVATCRIRVRNVVRLYGISVFLVLVMHISSLCSVGTTHPRQKNVTINNESREVANMEQASCTIPHTLYPYAIADLSKMDLQ